MRNDAIYSEWMESFGSEQTREAYDSDLRDFQNYVSADNANQAILSLILRPPDDAATIADDYKEHLIASGLAVRTIRRRLGTLRRVCEFCRRTKRIQWVLDVGLVLDEKDGPHSLPSKTFIGRMIETCRQRGDAKGIRDLSIIRLLYDLALWRGEVANLERQDVDLKAKLIHVLGRPRGARSATCRSALNLPEPTREALEAWIRIRGDEDGALWRAMDNAHRASSRSLTSQGVYWTIRSIGEQLGKPDIRPLTLRYASIQAAVDFAVDAGIGPMDVLKFSRLKTLRQLLPFFPPESEFGARTLSCGVASGLCLIPSPR